MSEKTITVDVFDLLDFFGVNDVNIESLRKFFPKLKIIARGDTLKLIGDQGEISSFESKFASMIRQYKRTGIMNEQLITEMMSGVVDDNTDPKVSGDEMLVHGRGGMLIKAKTVNQRRLVEASENNDLVFVIGPAGTGKTYTAVALAVRALKNKEVKRIVLTRPAVEAGENLGFLPGDLKDKLDPYLQPLYDALWDMLPSQKLNDLIADNVIEIAPLAFMRGRTLDNVFVILDEAQNATIPQMKMFLTRMGRSAKFIVTGDITQVDLPKNQASGLIQASGILKETEGLEFIYLDHQDIIRHKLVLNILRAYEGDQKK